MGQSQEKIVNGVKVREIHNKLYVEVAERVKLAHEKRVFEMVESEPFEIAGRVLWRVVILVDSKMYKGSAEVKLAAPKNTPDGTNPFECAETSAVGRALGFAGLGTIESIASYDEIARSQPTETGDQQTNRTPPPAATPQPTNPPAQPRRFTPVNDAPQTETAKIRARLEALKPRNQAGKVMNWPEMLATAMSVEIKARKTTVGDLVKLSNVGELPEEYQQLLLAFIDLVEAA